MRAKSGPGTRDRFNKRSTIGLPDGAGGTIAGCALQPLDLMAVFARAGQGAPMGGPTGDAMPGAAREAPAVYRAPMSREDGVRLSDGSRIVFASLRTEDMFADA